MAYSARLAAKSFGRGTDLDAMPREYYELGIAFEMRRKDELQREQEERRREQLAAFADAVRRKERWYLKVLDARDLTRKWAEEAQLDAGGDLDAYIREIEQEARRICILDHSLRLASASLPERVVDSPAISADVQKSVTYLRAAKHGIDQPELYEDVGVYVVDDAVPRVLHAELVRELDSLASAGPKDFHPKSEGKVQDLIHPSLYPYTADTTPLPPSVNQPRTNDGMFKTSIMGTHPHNDDVHKLASKFAWIPAVFAVSEDGQKVTIDGYINGLGSRAQYPVLFEVLEQTFLVVMPLLEKTASHEFKPQENTPSHARWKVRSNMSYRGTESATWRRWNEVLADQQKQKVDERSRAAELAARRADEKEEERARFAAGNTGAAPVSSWAGRKLKVIVKAANYILKPGQDYTGSWHIEGMPHEWITASAIYYYERDDSIEDAGLYLRRKRDGEDFPDIDEHHRDGFTVGFSGSDNEFTGNEDDGDNYILDKPSDYGSDVSMADLKGYINVGKVPTTGDGSQGTGRIVTFPNWVQHRVVRVANSSTDKVATRKILCFFLVDDEGQFLDEIAYYGFSYTGLADMHVLSSVDVPSQARACNLPTLRFLLPVACRQRTHGRRTLPPELVESIVAAALADGGLGITREEAEIRRRELMADRKVGSVGVSEVWEQQFSLCEH